MVRLENILYRNWAVDSVFGEIIEIFLGEHIASPEKKRAIFLSVYGKRFIAAKQTSGDGFGGKYCRGLTTLFSKA